MTATDATGNQGACTLTFTVTAPATLPAPWQKADLGTVGLPGSAAHTNGAYTLKGAGVGVASTADGFYFVYQTLSADGEIKARITSMDNTSANARAGVMIRESLTAGSRNAFMGISPDRTFRFQHRASTGGTTASLTGSTGTFPNVWVRLVRSGKTLTGYRSSNGTSWTKVGSRNITMASQIQIGLAVSSAATNVLNRSVFDNVTAVP